MNTINLILKTVITSMLIIPLIACEPKGPAEKAGERIDETTEEIGDSMEDVGENLEEALDQ